MAAPDYKTEFIKVLKSIDNSKRTYEVFTDFLNMASISMANVILKKTDYETEYMNTIGKYKRNTDKFPELFCIVKTALEINPCQDFLGTIYQELNLNSKSLQQHFTPYHVANFMAQINMGIKEDIESLCNCFGYFTLLEPCSGSGTMIIAVREVLMQYNLCWSTRMLFDSIDLDFACFNMTYIQTNLLGLSGYVYWGNSLTQNMYRCYPTLALVAAPEWQERNKQIEYINLLKKCLDIKSPTTKHHDKIINRELVKV